MRIPVKVLIRDLVLIAATFALLNFSHALEAQKSGWNIPVALLAGLMIAVVGYLIHEWGHLIGALLKRGIVELPQGITAVFLFRFDTGLNSREQFLSMSYGGFVASLLAVVAYFSALSFDHLADGVALGLTIIGVIATFVLEVPVALGVYRTGVLPRGAAFVDGREHPR